MKKIKNFENYNSNILVDKMDDIYNTVKEVYPEYEGETLNWINPKDSYSISFGGDMWNIMIGKDEWTRGFENFIEEEEYGTILDPSIDPEVEIYFQSEEEADCYVYTDKMGNIRSLYLNID